MNVLSLEIVAVTQETPESKSFYFKWPPQTNVVYKAGQFITLLININGKETRRSYSLSSTPGINITPFITIKRVQNGLVSRYFYDRLQPGNRLHALVPAGRFLLQQPLDVHFFIAAGSGITPVFAIIKEVLFNHPGKQVILLYQNTNEEQAIFRKQLLKLREQFSQSFTLLELFSQPIDHTTHPHRLNNYLLEHLVKKYVQTTAVQFYLCGPTSFMLLCVFTLKFMGYRDMQIKKENFSIKLIPPPPPITDFKPHDVLLHFEGNVHRFTVTYPENILQAALKNNIPLPYSCRGGLCSTCMATCLQGKIQMSHNEVLTEDDTANGLVLTCVGYPLTNVELFR